MDEQKRSSGLQPGNLGSYEEELAQARERLAVYAQGAVYGTPSAPSTPGTPGTIEAPTGQPEASEEDQGGVVDDIFTGIVDGAAQAVSEIPQTFVDIADFLAPEFVNDEWTDGKTAQFIEDGIITILEKTPGLSTLNKIGNIGTDGRISDRIEDGADGVAGTFAKEITRNVIAFVGVGKFGKALNIGTKFAKNHKIIATAARGAIADGISVNPFEERAADLLKDFEITTPLGEILGTDEDASGFENRLKAAVEGTVLGEGFGLFGKYVARKIRFTDKYKDVVKGQLDAKAESALSDEAFNDVNEKVVRIATARQAADDALMAHEYYHSFRPEAPAVREARGVLDGTIDEGSISEEGSKFLEGLRYQVEGPDVDDLDAAARAQLDTLQNMTPRELIAESDPAAAARLDELLGDSGNIDDLGKLMAENEAGLVKAEQDFVDLVTSDTFLKADKKFRERVLKALKSSTREANAGGKRLAATDSAYERVAAAYDEMGIDYDSNLVPKLDGRTAGEAVKPLDASQIAQKAFGRFKMSKNDFEKIKTIAGDAPITTQEQLDQVGEVIFSGDAGSSNFNSLINATDPDAFNNGLAEVSEFLNERLFKKNPNLKGTTNAETKAQAEKIIREMANASELGEDMETILHKRFGKSTGPERLGRSTEELAAKAVASRVLLKQTYARFQKLAQSGAPVTNNAQQLELLQTAKFLAEVHKMDRGLGSDIGRALQARKIKVEGMGTDDFNRLMDQNFGDPRKIVETLTNGTLVGPEDVANVMRGTAADGWFTHWMGGLLSNPGTWTVNLVSGYAKTGYQPIEDALAAAFRGQGRESVEHLRKLAKAPRAQAKAFKAARIAWRSGQSSIGVTDLAPGAIREGRLGQYADNYLARGGDPNDVTYRSIKGMDYVMDVPGKVLLSSDELIKTANYSMESEFLARKYVLEKFPDLKGQEYKAKVSEIMEQLPNWSEIPDSHGLAFKTELQEMDKLAKQYASTQTWTQDITGTGAVADLVNSFNQNKAGRWILPFARTPLNLIRDTAAHIPLMDTLVKAERAKYGSIARIISGNASGADRTAAAAKMASLTMGMGVMATAFELADEGIITGSGPLEPTQRAAWMADGRQQNSILIGGKWIRYDRVLPVGALMGLIADYHEISNDMDYATASSVNDAIAEVTVNRMSDLSFTKGIFEFLNAIDDPDNIGRYMASQAATLVPLSQGVRFIRNATDPTMRETRGEADGDTDVFVQAINEIKNTLPGFSMTLPPRRNMFYEPQTKMSAYGYDALNPFGGNPASTDPRREQLGKLSISFDMRSLNKKDGIVLSPEQSDRWLELMNGGGRMQEQILSLFDNERFQAVPDQEKQKVIEKILSKRKRAAFKRMVQEKGNEELLTRFRIGKLRNRSGGNPEADTLIAALEATL